MQKLNYKYSSIKNKFHLNSSIHFKAAMSELPCQQLPINESKPLQNIKTIEQSLMILKNKVSQMNKREFQNVKQIQKVFYSSIPILKTKLSQSVQYQKNQQKKRNNFNQNVLRHRIEINREKKMINQKEIQRNRQLINIMKINQHNSIKELSKKNQLYIQKMKNQRFEQNKQKKQAIRGCIENSRLRVMDFHLTKQELLKKQKQEENENLKKKMSKMKVQLGKLGNKENQTAQKVEKTNQALRQLRFAVNKMEKMNEDQFIKLKNAISQQQKNMSQQRIIQRILTKIIEDSKQLSAPLANKTLYNSRWSSGHLQKIA